MLVILSIHAISPACYHTVLKMLESSGWDVEPADVGAKCYHPAAIDFDSTLRQLVRLLECGMRSEWFEIADDRPTVNLP